MNTTETDTRPRLIPKPGFIYRQRDGAVVHAVGIDEQGDIRSHINGDPGLPFWFHADGQGYVYGGADWDCVELIGPINPEPRTMNTPDKLKQVTDTVRDIVNSDSCAPAFVMEAVNEILGMLQPKDVHNLLNPDFAEDRDLREEVDELGGDIEELNRTIRELENDNARLEDECSSLRAELALED